MPIGDADSAMALWRVQPAASADRGGLYAAVVSAKARWERSGRGELLFGNGLSSRDATRATGGACVAVGEERVSCCW